jgi:hypothetical protein
MGYPIVVMQAPCFPFGVGDVFETGYAGVVVPDFAAPPGAVVEDMVKSSIDYAAMTDKKNMLFMVTVDDAFDEDADSGPEMDK